MTTLGQRLRQAMGHAKIGPRQQNEFNRRVGLPAGTVSRLVNDRFKRPNMEYVRALASELTVSFAWLATGSGPMRTETENTTLELRRKFNEMTEEPERYPNCISAANLAREANYDTLAVLSIVHTRFDIGEDKPVGWWLSRMQALADVINVSADSEVRATHLQNLGTTLRMIEAVGEELTSILKRRTESLRRA